MKVKLTGNWRRFAAGKILTGGAAREALADKAGKEVKAKAIKPAEAKEE